MIYSFCLCNYRARAEEALARLNGTQLGGQSIRLSWGRTPSNKQVNIWNVIMTNCDNIFVADTCDRSKKKIRFGWLQELPQEKNSLDKGKILEHHIILDKKKIPSSM